MPLTLETLILFLFSFLGGVIYRWRGMDRGNCPFHRPWPQIVLSAPYGLVVYYSLFQSGHDFVSAIACAVCVFVSCWAMFSTGHGNGMDIGRAKRGEEDESMEWAVKWLYGRIPENFYDIILMAWLGLAITIPAGIACGSVLLGASGVLRAVAYVIGWKAYEGLPRKKKRNAKNGQFYSGIKKLPYPIDYATGMAEFLVGVFLWGALGLFFTVSFL